jgi:formate dehydrogenase major subunit
MLDQAANIIVVYGMDQCLERSRDDVRALASLLLQMGKIGRPGNGLILVRDYANAQGQLDMGADSRYLPGLVRPGQPAAKRLADLWGLPLDKVFGPVDLVGRLKKGGIKALLVFGEDPLASAIMEKLVAKAKLRVVFDFFLTATAEAADVVLPMSSPLESAGTYTACDRRVQRSAAILPPLAGMTNLEAIAKLSGKLGMELGVFGPEEVFKEIGQANPHYLGVAPGEFWGKDLFHERFSTASGKAKFLPLAIDLTPCNQERQPLLSTENYVQTKIKNKLVV